jgi:general stress protein 26
VDENAERMEVETFADIGREFVERVHSMFWCNFATADGKVRPYSRVLHPIWEGSTGWIPTHRHSHQSRHLDANPHASSAYIRGDVRKPVYVDRVAESEENRDEKRRIWDLVVATPPPLGHDPTADFVHPDYENFGLLRLSPWRIILATFPAPSPDAGHRIWRRRGPDRSK